ncbi:MAG: PBP1A family penicillin-binding protein [Verrucomicrobiales bacterium]|nr:PBP1A family penicillin-binding protein [Verrucomicrobiales bacterium]
MLSELWNKISCSVTCASKYLYGVIRTGDGTWKARVLRIGLVLLIALIPLVLAVSITWGVFQWRAAKFDLAEIAAMNERTWVLDRDGNRLGHVSGHGENRQKVPLTHVSPFFIKALLAREDNRFYKHHGVDWIGVARAAVRNINEGEIVQGASTLTMQLVRNTYGGREQSYERKLLEAALAKRLERNFTKDEILEAYVNRIYFGSGLYGIERAAQGYFMKPASELTLGESALLAGIIRAPSAMNPFRESELAYDQQNQVLERMVSLGVLEKDLAEEAKKQRLFLRPGDKRMATLDYVLESVHEELNRFLPQEMIVRGGLKIYTTIDSKLQEQANRILDEKLTEVESRKGFPHPSRAQDTSNERTAWTDYVQGSLVVLENKTGDILAMVGGRDYGDSPFNRAIKGRRQLGSTFKPFIYAAAFARGAQPGMLISDGPIAMPGGNGKPWRPQNSDGKYGGYFPMATGLIRSRNTMTIRVGNSAGIENVIAVTEAVRLPASPPPYSPVAYLGTFDSSPLKAAGAYSTLANRGVYRSPRFIRKIETVDGTLLYQDRIRETQAIPVAAAWTTSEVLREVMLSGTGASATRLGYQSPAHGKTGTTNDYKDAWFCGYTDKITCAVWVGMDRPQTIMYKGYGSTLALPVWVEVMKAAGENGYPAEPLRPPEGYRAIRICKDCGLIASGSTSRSYAFTLPPEMMPLNTCMGRHIYSNPGFNPNYNTTSTIRRDPTESVREAVRSVTRPLRRLGRKLFGR